MPEEQFFAAEGADCTCTVVSYTKEELGWIGQEKTGTIYSARDGATVDIGEKLEGEYDGHKISDVRTAAQ